MNLSAEAQRELVIEYLEDSTELHLVDCLDMVSDQHITSICVMIKDNSNNRVPMPTTRNQVVHDVAALVEGHPEEAHHSKHFLKTV